MAPLTSIANRLTPSTPIETSFGSQPVATGTKIATLIGHRNAAAISAAQTNTFTPVGGAPTVAVVYKVTIDDVDYSYTAQTGDDWGDVIDALAALVQADTAAPATAANVATTLKLTGKTNAAYTASASPSAAWTAASTPRGGTAANYTVYQVTKVGDPASALLEVDALAGDGSEVGKMARAFVAANSSVSTGARNYPPFRVLLLPNAETSYGPADEAINLLKAQRNDFVVGPYAAESAVNRAKLLALAVLISGPDRTGNGQFGTTAVLATQAAAVTAFAINADSQYLMVPYQLDSNGTKAQTVAELAAAFTATVMQLTFPYLGLDGVEVGGLLPPTTPSDKIIQGANEMSELALAAGLAPLTFDSANRVRIIRSRLTRVTIDGSTPATAYIDWQDVVPLYDFKEDMYNVLQQPQFKNQRATSDPSAGSNLAGKINDEQIRIAKLYEKATVFQFVNELAPRFKVEPSISSRGRFDFFVPADVAPILHVVAGNVQGLVFTA